MDQMETLSFTRRLSYPCVMRYETKRILLLYAGGSSAVLHAIIHWSVLCFHGNVHPKVRWMPCVCVVHSSRSIK
jgi:hypothetical protein